MIIPIRCVTCGKVLADKYRRFQDKMKNPPEDSDKSASISPNDGVTGTPVAVALSEMKITKMCCRRHMLTNVDAMDRI